MNGATLRIGIDLGGTKIEGLALSRDGTEVARRRIETPKDYDQTLVAIDRLISLLEGDASAASGQKPPGSVGVGIPGTLSPATRIVKNSNSTWLNGHAFDKDLEEIMGRPIRVMNDANCFALSEAFDGAGMGADVVFGVILGTGVGAGIVVGGHILEGHQGIGGEWGHIVLGPDGSECYRGQRGCVETFLSGPFLETFYARRSGTSLPLGDISKRAIVGQDVAAVETINRLVTWFGRGVATVINILDPTSSSSAAASAMSMPSTPAASKRWRPGSSTTPCRPASCATSSATPPASSAPPCSWPDQRSWHQASYWASLFSSGG